MITVAEARRIISNGGSHLFPDESRQAALAAVEELQREGHAVTSASAHATGERARHELQVTHFLSCRRCAEMKGEQR